MTADGAFEAYEQRVEFYSRTWWVGPGPHRDVFAVDPALRAALYAELAAGVRVVQSTRVYRPARDWWPARVEEHAALLDVLCPPLDEAGEIGAVYFTLGLPGAGKTSVLRPIALEHAGAEAAAAVVDADAVRAGLPDYGGGLGSTVVQGETVVVTYGDDDYPPGGGMNDRAYGTGSPLIVDVMGGPDTPVAVEALAGRGFEVFILLAQCPPEVCKQRVKQRALETGRYLPPELIDERQGGPRDALDAAVGTGAVAGWGVWDTSGSAAAYVTGDGAFGST